jgi:hypothetical protein
MYSRVKNVDGTRSQNRKFSEAVPMPINPEKNKKNEGTGYG